METLFAGSGISSSIRIILLRRVSEYSVTLLVILSKKSLYIFFSCKTDTTPTAGENKRVTVLSAE